ncbi:MAG TPA: ABC transporter permease [Vicinamibacterales bacterium]|nr:ABC transporter permease [Vicinamibacterales bacterium]
MKWITAAWQWACSMARRRALEARLDDEIRFHIDQQLAKNLRAGMTPEEARCHALLVFGGVERAKERTQEEIRPALLDDSLRDVRHGYRILRQAPVFSGTAVIMLALGIGASTTLFSIINAVLLRPLPYPDPDRLVWVGETRADLPFSSAAPGALAYQNFDDWRAKQTVFDSVGAYQPSGGSPGNFLIGGEPLRMEIQRMSADAFAALRIAPIVGRVFNNDEDRRGGNPSVVLSYRAWQDRFGGQPIVGQPVTMNGVVHTIVGVMPPGFSFPYKDIEAWLPLGSIPAPPRVVHDLAGVARLKSGATIDHARAEFATIVNGLAEAYPDANKGWRGRVEPMVNVVVGDVGQRLWLLFGAVTIVLLIACANVANLLLARASARQPEIALRAALGASRSRIVRQLLIESLLLSLIGAGLGLLLTKASLTAFLAFAGNTIPRAHEVRLNGAVVTFAVGLAACTGVAFGLAPAWMIRATTMPHLLRAASGRSSDRNGHLGQALIVAEVALTLVLLMAAGLLLRSFQRLQSVDQGFNTEHVVSFDLTIPGVKYRTRDLQSRFFDGLVDKLRALPGVEDVGFTSRLPLKQKTGQVVSYSVEGRPTQADRPLDSMDALIASPGYFRAMGIQLLRGRLFTEQDGPGVAAVVVVDDELAKRTWPDADPIGRHIRVEAGPNFSIPLTVIGVVARVKLGSLHDRGGLAQAYLPAKQVGGITGSVVLKSRLAPAALTAAIRAQVRGVDAAQPVQDLRTIQDIRDDSLASDRLNVNLLGVFAGVALALSVGGLYGVLAYSVARRQREIGVRTALGAQASDVLRLVVGDGLRLAVAGILLGIVGSFWSMRWLSNLLFETRPFDLATVSAVSLLMLAVALAACWIPAVNAVRLDLLRVLRDQ